MPSSVPRFVVLVAVIMVAVRPLTAQGAPTSCSADSNSHRFDFWIGSWEVTPAGATEPVGHSVVTPVAGGCGLLENWRSSNGIEGNSLNAWNAVVGAWQQFWVGPGGVTEYRTSRWNSSTLIFEGSGNSPRGPVHSRLSFTRIDSVTVRQVGETSTDGGKNWSPGFDYLYHRVTP